MEKRSQERRVSIDLAIETLHALEQVMASWAPQDGRMAHNAAMVRDAFSTLRSVVSATIKDCESAEAKLKVALEKGT
jgi:hypothetical protein